jgi:hypothetical protein
MEDWTEHLDNHNSALMYIVNSMGPRTLPWGIPLVTSVHFELDPLSTTFCLRSDKKFLIHSNDLPDVVQNVAKLFADDTKLYAAVNNTNHEIKLQGDIDRLMQWSKEWLIPSLWLAFFV